MTGDSKRLHGKAQTGMRLPPPKRRGLANDLLKHRSIYLLALPGILFFFVFHYLPMAGIIIAV